MKKRIYRMLCALLCALICLLSACEGQGDTEYDAGSAARATVAYIPLDDRPINTRRVELLCRASGFRLIMPEAELYSTRLDGQAEGGRQCGDPDALLSWLCETDADFYLLSLDQLLSGGLVNSRCESDTSDDARRIERLFDFLEGRSALLFDTVMRLSPTVGYMGADIELYNALREYGSLPRKALGAGASADDVIAAYALPSGGSELQEDVISGYLAARSRKLKLAEAVTSAAAELPSVTLFYGIDDSCRGESIQTNEIAFIRERIANGCIFSGTDELGLMGIAHIAALCGALPSVSVGYFGADPEKPSDIYDSKPLGECVGAHMSALGLSPTEYSSDIELLVYGGGDTDALLSRYKKNAADGRFSAVVDTSGTPLLARELLSGGELDSLLAFSAWNTGANSVGIALSSAVSRYIYLSDSAPSVEGADSAFVLSLALAFAKDVSYASAKPLLDGLIASQGGDASSFYASGIDADALGMEALSLIEESELPFSYISDRLARSRYTCSLSPRATEPFPRLTLVSVSFPWYRSFEAELLIELSR